MVSVLLGMIASVLVSGSVQALDCNGFKIWSFNIRYNDGWACVSDCTNEWLRTGGRIARRDVAESYLKAGSPDIFGLQEVRDPAASPGVRASQLDDVASWFPNHDYYARDRGDGEHCAVFYRKTRFIRLDSGTFWMSCFPDVPESKYPSDAAGNYSQRITSWVRLLDSSTGTSFYVFNGHWSLLESARRYTAALVRERVKQIAGGSPVILLGDFNCTENSTPFKILSGTSSYTDEADCLIRPADIPWSGLRLVNSYREAVPVASPDEGSFHAFFGNIGGSRIDHVLHSTNDFAATSASIRHDSYEGHCGESMCYPSDHFAVEVRLRILLQNAYVNFKVSEVNCESGAVTAPFNSLEDALATVKPSGTVFLATGNSPAGRTIDPTRGPVTLTAFGGPVVIGK